MSRWAMFSNHEADRLAIALADANALVRSLVDQNGDLVKQIASMKRDNFDAPAPVQFEKQEPRFPAPVVNAISQRANPRSREWAHLEGVAADMVAAGESQEAITAAILEGENPDDLL